MVFIVLIEIRFDMGYAHQDPANHRNLQRGRDDPEQYSLQKECYTPEIC
jgi:hypothetical protein